MIQRENVGGPDITVNHAGGVRRIQDIGDLDGQVKQRFQLQRSGPG